MTNDNRVFRGPQAADQRILVPSERVITRNAGCWNCSKMRDATTFWFGDKDKGTLGRREENLQRAVKIAIESPVGERDQRVMNIKRMVMIVDDGISKRAIVRCGGGHAEGEVVANSFMCEHYVGADGASVARGTERINDLPEEVRDKIDGSGPTNTSKIEDAIAAAKKDGVI